MRRWIGLAVAVVMLMLGSLSFGAAQDTTPAATSAASNEAQSAVATAQSEAQHAVATAQREAGSIAATAQASVQGAAGTPIATGGASAVGNTPVGTALTINGQDGSPQSRVTVNKVIDNFKEYDPDFGAPKAGTHDIAVEFTFENIGKAPIKVNPFDLFLLDGNGFVYDNDFVELTQAAQQHYPQLGDNENMAPGNKVSGWLFYTVPDNTQIARVIWQPDSSRLIFLADLTAK